MTISLLLALSFHPIWQFDKHAITFDTIKLFEQLPHSGKGDSRIEFFPCLDASGRSNLFV